MTPSRKPASSPSPMVRRYFRNQAKRMSEMRQDVPRRKVLELVRELKATYRWETGFISKKYIVNELERLLKPTNRRKK